MKKMSEHFDMHEGFDSCIVPPRFLFGHEVRETFDKLTRANKEAGYSQEGPINAVYGSFGQGKSHLARCLESWHTDGTINILLDCPPMIPKSPVTGLLAALLQAIPESTIHDAAKVYSRHAEDDPSLEAPVRKLFGPLNHDEIVERLCGGRLPGALAWLGGEHMPSPWPQIKDPIQAARNVAAIAEIIFLGTQKIPVFLVDSAENLRGQNAEQTILWSATFQELFSAKHMGLSFFVRAKDPTEMPNCLSAINKRDIFRLHVEDIKAFLSDVICTIFVTDPLTRQARELLESKSYAPWEIISVLQRAALRAMKNNNVITHDILTLEGV